MLQPVINPFPVAFSIKLESFDVHKPQITSLNLILASLATFPINWQANSSDDYEAKTHRYELIPHE